MYWKKLAINFQISWSKKVSPIILFIMVRLTGPTSFCGISEIFLVHQNQRKTNTNSTTTINSILGSRIFLSSSTSQITNPLPHLHPRASTSRLQNPAQTFQNPFSNLRKLAGRWKVWCFSWLDDCSKSMLGGWLWLVSIFFLLLFPWSRTERHSTPYQEKMRREY